MWCNTSNRTPLIDDALFVCAAWSMESGEHMPDKKRFVNELFRVTKPDGRIIIVTWCHRELRPGETKLASWELKLLNKISTGMHTHTSVNGPWYQSLILSKTP
jgi:tocopherol O-methyltransferase